MRLSNRALALLTVGGALWVTGCGVQASEEWALHAPDAFPHVTRIEATNALLQRGPVLGGEVLVADRSHGLSVRSGGLLGGYGFRNIVPNRCLDVSATFVGRLSLGKPALTDSPSLRGGLGSRAELSFSEPRSLDHEELSLLIFRPELVVGFDWTTWFRDDIRYFDVSGGIGLRFAVVSDAGPPLLRFLKALL